VSATEARPVAAASAQVPSPEQDRGHVVMLLSNDAVSDPRVEKEAVALSGDGWRVTIVAWDRSQTAPAAEEREGYSVRRIGPPAVHGGGARNVSAYREFWRRAAELAIETVPDVVHCHDLDTVPAGVAAVEQLRPRKVRLVEDFHELYRESKMVPQRGLLGVAARAAVRVIENNDIPKADLVLVANPGTSAYYDRFGVSDRLVVVENAPDLERYHVGDARRPGDPFTVCFIGQKRYTAGLYSLMEAIQPHEDMRAVIAGGGVAEAEVAERAKRYERVEAVGRVSYADIPALYEGCSAVFAVYDTDLGNVRTLFPVKVMEAMAVGVPVIVASGTWIAEYVQEHRLGYAVDGSDAASVAAALVALRDDPDAAREMGLRGRRIVEEHLNWRSAADRLLRAYRRLFD